MDSVHSTTNYNRAASNLKKLSECSSRSSCKRALPDAASKGRTHRPFCRAVDVTTPYHPLKNINNNKSVQFASSEMNQIHQVEIVPTSLAKFVWYSPKEMAAIKIKRKRMAEWVCKNKELIRQNDNDDNKRIIEWCTRGLENLLDTGSNKRRIQRKRDSITSVIKEQNRQRRAGEYPDPEMIATLYSSKGPLRCQHTAYEKGIQDQNQCYSIYNTGKSSDDINSDRSCVCRSSRCICRTIDEALWELDSIMIDRNISSSLTCYMDEYSIISKPDIRHRPATSFLKKLFLDYWNFSNFESIFYEQ